MQIASLVTAAVLSVGGPHRTLDLRTYTESDGASYSLAVCARPSASTTLHLPGHAFIGYGITPRAGARSYLAVGHTTFAPPGTALLTYLGVRQAVSGSLEEELFTATSENCLVLLVNRPDYDRAVAAATDAVTGQLPDFTRGRRTVLRYTLGAQDCINFVIRVLEPFAKTKRVTLPERGGTELPLEYIRRIIDAN